MSMSSIQGGIGTENDVATGGIRGATASGRLHAGGASPLRAVDVALSGIVVPALAISGACLAVVSIAGAARRGSPWAGINAIAAGLGLTGARPARRFDPVVSLAGLGTAIGGSFVLAGLHHVVSRRIGVGRVAAGAIMTSLAAVTLDKLFMRRAIFPAFANALGVRGIVVKYAAIGAAAALTSR